MLYSTALDIAALLYDNLDASGRVEVLGSVIGALYSARDVAAGKILAWIEGRLMGIAVEAPTPPDNALSGHGQDFRGELAI
jgi:hypothetical protein